MSDDALRYDRRRALLRAALREGDATAAARAASRLRVDGFPLTPEEFARARAARHLLGLALVKARMPKPAEGAPAREIARLLPQTGRRRRLAAVAAVLAGLLLVLLFGNGVGLLPGGGDASPPRVVEATRAPLLTVSRGRTISLPVEVVVAEESPAPSAAPEPSPTAVDTAPPAATAGAGSGSGGSGSGGSGGGTGGGSGGGAGAGLIPTPVPTPAPTPTPRLPRPGYARLNFVVYDASTMRPLADVCIVAGALDCGPTAPHTDANGRASIDVAASAASTRWDILFIKAGFVTQTKSIRLPGGAIQTYPILLRRQG